jgi:hypothetical protein
MELRSRCRITPSRMTILCRQRHTTEIAPSPLTLTVVRVQSYRYPPLGRSLPGALFEGTNARKLLSDDALKKELCQRMDRNAPGNFCNDETESAPSPQQNEENPSPPPTALPRVNDTAPASGAGYSLTLNAQFLVSLVCSAGWLSPLL